MIPYLSRLFLSFFIATSIYADDSSAFISPEWKNLLHYENNLTGITSDIDDSKFFIAPDGKANPQSELTENIARIKALNVEYICQFPARFKYLNKFLNLKLDEKILQKCDKYQQFLVDHYPKSVHLVFSSYYLESPASAFGHTFLRFSKNDYLSDDKQSELLDVGINYGASNTTDNPLLYTIYGIAGGFQGTFSSIPYFYKIREYNDFESRDLWSYELNFTEAQKEKLLDHLWELGGTWYYYYFFTGNCSQKILSLLDGVEPSWNFLEQLPFYIIPAETIKVIHKTPGLVRKITFRPSKRRIFQETYAQLSKKEKIAFKQIIEDDNWSLFNISDSTSFSKTKVLDVIIEFIDYKYSKDILLERGPKYEWKNQILQKRSQLSDAGVNLEIQAPVKEEPHLAHPPRKIKLLVSKTEDVKDYSLKFSHRFALHDFTDSIEGNPKLSSINFFRTDFEITKKSIALDSFTPVEVSSFNPWGSYFYPISIYGIIDYSKDKKNLCANCRIFKGSMASGPSWSILNDKVIPFLFLSTDFMYSTSLDKEFDFNAGIMAGAIIRVYDFFSTYLRYQKGYAVFNKKENYLTEVTGQFHHTKHFDTSFEITLAQKKKQYMLGFNFLY